MKGVQTMSYQKNVGPVRRFAKAMKFAAWLQSLPNKLTPPPFRLMQIGSAFWQSRALYVATRLDIASVLGNDELPAEDIAARVAAHPDATARLLRLLAAMGIFEESGPRTYRNNKLSSFLRADNPQNVRAMILMHNSEAMSRPWYEQLEGGVRQGESPFRLAHGEELYAYMDRHADFDALFSEAMDSVEALTGDSFATDFDWSRFERIIDLGGSRGDKSLAILKRHPQLTALVVDRPQVIAQARQHWASHGSNGLERLSFEAGDLLASIPPARDGRDIYLLSAVLHGFDDDTCITALKNVASASASGASGAPIALLEMVLPETRTDLAGASFDMQMFMGTRGRERTLEEWKSLFERSGLALREVVGLQSFGNILVLLPA
ncbi:MAG: methyltransferase [Rhodocyclaceae bacterium]|nr:methyltransferase [Rhodocyclaceae bacterium]